MQRSFWEKKAQTFPRFKKGAEDTLEILTFFQDQGVDFRDKVVFDIGCGNGRFALEIAFLAKKVIGSDISTNMLAFLEEDAKTLGLDNIRTLHTDWVDFDVASLEEKIDIAFASMTPALNNKQGLLKAINLSEQGLCYVGWGRLRECEFLAKILSQHNITLLLPKGLPNVLEWLQEEGYKQPKYLYRKADFTYQAPIQKAIDDIVWHVSIHEGEPNLHLIEEYVRQNERDGQITYTHSREVGIAFIPKKSSKKA
ncbi:class I SAM-dependent methyltransferase [Helicobacter sp. MIT 05-5293]|uniref:class I SAM-dependent methyltransferase n=1 Tax=Helicobacter sp. MIT 05-5293 TaxID=1548149 RepID=UPI00051D05B9|nr:class I SAM-dependent methyltransferase [Helicobacter sp. MIT 05-5293]TLD81498.1 class I SAM-dependent methyltransferase [Helicobacter sp. MIT 05-5293]